MSEVIEPKVPLLWPNIEGEDGNGLSWRMGMYGSLTDMIWQMRKFGLLPEEENGPSELDKLERAV